jgi:O-antigen ligase
MVLLAGAIGYTTFLRLRRITRERVPVHMKLLLAFILMAMASSLYSIEMKTSLTKSVEFLAFFGFLLGLHFQFHSLERMERLVAICAWTMVAALVLNLAAIPLLPSIIWNPSLPDRLQALADNPNSLGGLCALSYALCLWLYPRQGRRGKAFLLTMGLATVVLHLMTGSRSTMATAVVAAIVWFAAMRQVRYAALLSGLMIVAIAASSAVSIASFKREEYATSSAKTLTGRTEFWKAAAILIRENPLKGYGFEVSGKVWDDPRFKNEDDTLWSGTSRASLHNGYVNAVIGLGIPGLTLWLIILAMPLLGPAAKVDDRLKAIVLAVVLPTFVLNFVETAISTSNGLGSILFWIFWAVAGKLRSLRLYNDTAGGPHKAGTPFRVLKPSVAASNEH